MRRLLLGLVLLLSAGPAMAERVLIYSGTTGYRHDSIEAGIAAFRTMAEEAGLEAIASEDPAVFSDAGLRDVKAIVLLNTTTRPDAPDSEWLTGPRAEALQRFVAAGGGIVAVHAAADSHYHQPWYRRLIGARFASHPPGTPEGTLRRVDRTHPGTRDLPNEWKRADEWYDYADFDPTSRLLLTVDPAGTGLDRVNASPIAWTREVDGGRVFYTGLGHRPESFSEPLVLAHMAGGLRWAIGRGWAPPARVIVDAETRRDEPTPHGAIGMSTADRISDGAPHRTMEFRRRILHPGAAIGVHPIQHDEVYHVESGVGELTADGRVTRLEAGMTAYLYDGSEVGIRQQGDQPLSLIVAYPIPR